MLQSALTTTMLRHDLGGRLTSSETVMVTDAPDHLPLYEVPCADDAIVDEAVSVARRGLGRWRHSTVAQRVAVLENAARDLDLRADNLAPQLVRETGKPLADAVGEVRSCARILRTYAHHVATVEGRVVRGHSTRAWGIEVQEPIGVAAMMISWNMPLQLAAMKIGGAVAAGCSFILKPSPLAAASVHELLLSLRRAELPSEAGSVLHGSVESTLALASHPDVDMISFTGGTRAGSAVMRAASGRPRRCVMELGGKSANVVFEDADLARAAVGLVQGFVRNQGAVCTAGSRILVHEQVFEEVVGRVLEELAAVRVGDPFGDADMGAIRNRELLESIETSVMGAVAAGGEVLSGGQRVEVEGRSGSYLQPTLVTAVERSSSLWQDEAFGPVAVISPFADEDDAIRQANDTDYGLAAGLWSHDFARLDRVARQLDVGTVYLNSYHRIDGLPLAASGRGLSGHGTEGGHGGIAEYLVSKSLHYPAAEPIEKESPHS